MKNVVITKGTKDSFEMFLIGLFTLLMLGIGFIYGR
jgi:hypothetical protein